MHAQVTAFNNSGVTCFLAGYPKRALALFKGSLEVQLAIERYKEGNVTSVSAVAHQPCYKDLAQHNPYVTLAEQVLDWWRAHAQSQRISSSSSVVAKERSGYRRRSQVQTLLEMETGFHFYNPYIVDRPFRISKTTQKRENGGTRSNSATIIFNLALMEQLCDSQSGQALSLYKLAMSLFMWDPHRAATTTADALIIALMNNMAVWYYENEQLDAAEHILCQLELTLQLQCPPQQYLPNSPLAPPPNPHSNSATEQLAVSEYAAIRKNLVNILIPQGSVSPAA
jgi:hypothetical protein